MIFITLHMPFSAVSLIQLMQHHDAHASFVLCGRRPAAHDLLTNQQQNITTFELG
jgi:hypothetical protein